MAQVQRGKHIKMLQQLEALQGGARLSSITVAPLKLQRMNEGRRGSVRCKIAEPSGKPAPMGLKTYYKDSWIENAMLGVFVRRLHKFTG